MKFSMMKSVAAGLALLALAAQASAAETSGKSPSGGGVKTADSNIGGLPAVQNGTGPISAPNDLGLPAVQKDVAVWSGSIVDPNIKR